MNDQTHDRRDPFEEASDESSALHNNPDTVGPASDEQPQPSALAPATEQPLSRPKPIATAIAVGAFALSVVSLGGVTYAVSQTSQLRSDVDVAFQSVDENIASLGRDQNDLDVMLSQIDSAVDTNSRLIQRLDTDQLAREIAIIKQDLSGVNTAFADSRADSQESIEALSQQLEELEELVSTLKLQAKRQQTSQERTQANRSPAPKPKPIPTVESLDGSYVVSVDQWGYSSNVVLHDQMTGEYVTVRQGGTIKGWKYIGADPKNQLTKFAKGQEVVHVKIRG